MKKSVKNTMAVCLLSLSMLAVACGKKDKNSSSNVESSIDAPESSILAPESSAPVSSSSSEAHVHSFGEWAVKTPATHTAEGVEERSCACGEKETRSIAKTTAHEFGEWTTTKPATHTAEGEQQRTCACGEKETKTIAKTSAHEFGEWTTKSHETCLEAEVLERTCACGETETKEGKPATGHDLYSDWRSDDTYHWHACKHDATEQLDKEEHVYDRLVQTEEYLKSTATPTSGNIYSMTCVCGKIGTTIYDDRNYVKVKSYTWIKEPTVDEFGIIKCSYDNFKDYTFQIPELGNTLFWKAEEVEIPGGTTINYTYSNTKIAVMSSNNWAKSNYDSTITETSQASFAYFLAYAGTPQGAFGTIGLSYTKTVTDSVFKNGYCEQTGVTKSYLYIEDVMSPIKDGVTTVVVTGKVEGADLHVGDKVTLYKNGSTETKELTIKSMEMYRKLLDVAEVGLTVGVVFEEEVAKEDFARGNLLADPEGNWEATTTLTGDLFSYEDRRTPIGDSYRPQLMVGTVTTTVQFSLPDGIEMIYPGERCDGLNITLLASAYVPARGEMKITEGSRTVGYLVFGYNDEDYGTYVPRVTVFEKAKPTDASAVRTTVSMEHFVDADGNQFEDPLMLKSTTVKNYELYVGVTGCGTITGRGTFLTCASNGIYEKDSSGWRTSGSVEMNDSYIGKMMATVEFVDADGVLTSSQHAITGAEKKSDGTYSFLLRGLERDAAENAVRMYVEA